MAEAHVAQWKKDAVGELADLIKAHKVVAVSSITGLPAPTFQEVRKKLQGKAVIKVVRLSLIKRALEKVGNKQMIQIESYLKGPVALILTNDDAFRLFAILKKSRSRAAIKTGQVAPFDIVVPAGDTGIPPGPALGDLKTAGINAKIEGSSIKVIKDSVVAKQGQTITEQMSTALNKLGVKPMELGMLLDAAYEEGTIFPASVLNVSEEETIANLQQGYRNAFNLAVNSAYTNKATIETLLQKGFGDARNLGINAMILDTGIIEHLLTKAGCQALALSAKIKK